MRYLMMMLVVLAACGDDIEPGSLIERQRILGARLEVAGDPMRATPMAGETLRVGWIQAAPGEVAELRWELSLCAVEDDKGACLGAETSYAGSGPTWSFVVPAGAARLRATGAIHAGEVRTAIDLRIAVAAAGEAMNHNPTIDESALAVADRCAEAGETYEMVLSNTVAERETYVDEDGESVREALQLSYFVTAGEMSTQYGFVDDGEHAAETQRIEWTAPGAQDVPAEGLDVELILVVRDGRGGLDHTTRTLCVVR